MRDRQTGESRAHSAEAHALALPVRWEIINAILDRSERKAWGFSSQCMEQSMRNVLHSPNSPANRAGGANLHPAPMAGTVRTGTTGVAAATTGGSGAVVVCTR